MKRFYSVREICEIAGLSRTTVWRRVNDGTLHPVRVGRLVRIPASSLDKWLGGQLSAEGGAR